MADILPHAVAVSQPQGGGEEQAAHDSGRGQVTRQHPRLAALSMTQHDGQVTGVQLQPWVASAGAYR